MRIKGIDRLVKSEPSLLLKDGQPLPGALRQQRVTQEELRAAIRTSGGAELSDAAFVVLESDGTLSAVLKR